MSRNQKFSKKSQDSTMGKIVSSRIGDAAELLNAIEFIESPQGIGVTLYPVQRVMVKAIFGVPFDFRPQMVPMYDVFREKIIRTVTEEEYLRICHEEGRCNVGNWRDLKPEGYNEAAVFAGRRGGKSQVVAAIGAYMLYKLLNVRSPQEYFALVPGSPLDFTFMAQDDEGANRLYDKLREDVNRSPFFNPYIRGNTSSEMTFITEADREKRDPTPTIHVRSYPCTTNAVRGPSSMFLALDEFAHFRSAKGSSSDEVYEAATPSTGQFVHKQTLSDGTSKETLHSLTLSISSPWVKVGKMYDLHRLAMEEGEKSHIFTLRCSTAEMNPRFPSVKLRQAFKTNNLTFKAEYGGNFLESSETYLPIASIRACTDVQYDETTNKPIEETGRLNIRHFTTTAIGRQYFWAIDLAFQNDATAVAIAHLEYAGGNKGIRLVYDYIDRMIVGEMFDGLGVPDALMKEKYKDYKVLPLEDIVAWLKKLNELMPCYRGATDQHGGQQLIQLMELNQIHNIELVHLTTSINSQMAYALKGYVDNTQCRFPYVPKFIKELENVEAEHVNKYQIRVQAPAEKGSHDDMVDAVQLCAYIAQEWLQDEGHLSTDPSGQSLAIQEQMNKGATPMTNIDGVSLRDISLLDKMRKMQENMGVQSFDVVKNPFHRRGR
jgi:hypothetical protein